MIAGILLFAAASAYPAPDAARVDEIARQRYLKRVLELIEAICSERSWTMPAHDLGLTNFEGTLLTVDLGAAHRAHTLAGTLAQLGDRIPSAVRAKAMSDALEEAGACVFLCSPAAAYVHGAIIPVDGGWLAR